MAGENATGARTVFAAVVALIGKPTKDGRILAAPEGFLCPVKEFPLPVLWTPPNHHGEVTPTKTVGKIENAYVIDNRLITFGHLFRTEEGAFIASQLAEGSRQLEIDIDSGKGMFDLEPDFLETGAGEITFTEWRLRSAWIGSNPCWDLPPVQIEEMTR